MLAVTWALVICQKCMPAVLGLRLRTLGIHFWQITHAHVTTMCDKVLQFIHKCFK